MCLPKSPIFIARQPVAPPRACGTLADALPNNCVSFWQGNVEIRLKTLLAVAGQRNSGMRCMSVSSSQLTLGQVLYRLFLAMPAKS
jgi:hypothetical protein